MTSLSCSDYSEFSSSRQKSFPFVTRYVSICRMAIILVDRFSWYTVESPIFLVVEILSASGPKVLNVRDKRTFETSRITPKARSNKKEKELYKSDFFKKDFCFILPASCPGLGYSAGTDRQKATLPIMSDVKRPAVTWSVCELSLGWYQ